MRKQGEYREIPIAAINREKQMVRAMQDDDHVIELSSSIAKNGLLEPIVVSPAEGGRYDLIAGAHRLAACERLGWETIPAMVRERGSDEPIRGLALIENIIRKDLTIEEEMEAVRYLYEEEKLSISQICQLLSKGRAWVEGRIAAMNYPEEVKRALLDGVIGIGVAEVLAGIQDDSLRRMLTNAAIAGKMTKREVEELRKAYESAENFAEAVDVGLQIAQEKQLREPAVRECEICGAKRTYLHLRPMWVCTDQEECMQRYSAQQKEKQGIQEECQHY